MQFLDILNENPVVLTGYLDPTGALQLAHATGNLCDASQSLEASHERDTSITVELHDFEGWQLNASHGLSWPRGTGFAYFVFREVTTDPVTVNVIATSGTQTKSRTIYVKTKPKGSLPLRP